MSRSHMVKILAAKSYGQEVTGISGRVWTVALQWVFSSASLRVLRYEDKQK